MRLPIADCRLPIVRGARVDAVSRRAALLRRGGVCRLENSADRQVRPVTNGFSIANRQSPIGNAAFTLIEIMIVVAIIGLIAAMGLPSIVKALQKDGMRKAVSDVEDVFFSAREQAIISNKKVAAVFYPRERRFGVEGAAAGDAGTVVNTHSGKTLVATLPDGIEFGMLDIFRQDYVQSDWARIFFNPDGTCDEAVIVLIGKGGSKKITLEYATGMPVVSDADQ